jgi:hypothetical protein
MYITHSNNTLAHAHKTNVTKCTLDTVRIRDNVLILQLSKNIMEYKYIFTERDLQKPTYALTTLCKLLTPRPQNNELFCVFQTGHLTNYKISFFDL